MPPKSSAQAKREAALAELAQKPRQKKGFFGGRRVGDKALTVFTSQLAILQDAGLPIVRCMKILEGQMKPGYFKWVLGSVTEDVESGSPLSDSLAKHPGVFDDLYVNMVKAGEAGGVLDTILARLSEFKEKGQRLRKRIVSASIYPLVVLVVATSILLGIMILVVPKFEMVFEEIGQGELPAVTQFMQDISKFLTGANGPFPAAGVVFLIFGVFLLVVLFRVMKMTIAGKRILDMLKLKTPLVGTLTKKTIVAVRCPDPRGLEHRPGLDRQRHHAGSGHEGARRDPGR
jgi:type IV pilus assembly protein PilC